jgi:hypothetical protein
MRFFLVSGAGSGLGKLFIDFWQDLGLTLLNIK